MSKFEKIRTEDFKLYRNKCLSRVVYLKYIEGNVE